jgi:diaminohydroxyphosphoribosylaminopyrimidine deaminase/5-amino-6-(5-phosphoribosylamino)uracil reductase
MTYVTDVYWMGRALELARRGQNTTMPNPRVGCVLVRNEQLLSEGWHEWAGSDHAEIRALKSLVGSAVGATAYVTLEPCSHHGKTPPCAPQLIQAQVARVVVAMQDPNPQVAGRGVTWLREAGIQVDVGVCEREAQEMNVGFISRMTRNRPWVRTKVAMSLDGKTALSNGRSQWITSEDARRDAHQWRARSCALLTGSGTVMLDNPRLTVRYQENLRQPVRIVLDSALETSPQSLVYQGDGRRVVVCTSDVLDAHRAYSDVGVEVVVLPSTGTGKVDLSYLWSWMNQQAFNEVMVEAGASLNGVLAEAQWIDEWLLYYAPCFLGQEGRGVMNWGPIEQLSERYPLEVHSVQAVGVDWRILARTHLKKG